MANVFSTTDFVVRVLGTYLKNHSAFLAVSYRAIKEFEKGSLQGGFAPGDNVDFKIPGYPDIQRGLAVTAQDIVDQVISYKLTEDDIYNFTYEIDIQSIGLNVVGGEVAFTKNPYSDKTPTELSPQGKQMIDDYVTPGAYRLAAELEKEITRKARAAAFYTPISMPDQLTHINDFSDLLSVRTLMNNLGFQSPFRYAFFNEEDYAGLNNSLRNNFNQQTTQDILPTGMFDRDALSGFDYRSSNTIEITDDSQQYLANPTSTGVQVQSINAEGTEIVLSGVIATAGEVFNAGTLISIPAVNLFNRVNQIAISNTLVVTVAADTNGNNDGTVTVPLSKPLNAVGMHANVNVLPAAGDEAFVWPKHRNNYCFIPMGVIANPVKLGEIHGADNNRYVDRSNNMDCTTYIQGVVTNGVNTFRNSCQCPTLVVPDYIVNLPSLV